MSSLPIREESYLYGLRKFLSVLLVLLLCPLISGQIAAASVRSLVRDSARVKAILRESGFYGEMEAVLTDHVMANLTDDGIMLTSAERQEVVDAFFPSERMQRIVEPAVEGLHAWFWSGAPRPELIVDLTELQASLPDVLRPILLAQMEALPICSPVAQAAMATSQMSEFLLCKTTDDAFNRQMVERAIPAAATLQLIPDRLDLAADLERQSGPDVWQELRMQVAGPRSVLQLIPYGWGLVLLLLLVLGLLNQERWSKPFGWLAAPLLMGGGLMLILSLLGPNLTEGVVARAIDRGVTASATVIAMLEVTTAEFCSLLRTYSLSTLVAGVSCVVTAVVGARRSSPNAGAGSDVA